MMVNELKNNMSYNLWYAIPQIYLVMMEIL